MTMKRPMTKVGYQKLLEELQHLKKVERGKNIQDIAEARSHGDLSENAEYHAAKERQAHIAGRIQELEHRLAMAQIIEPSGINTTDKVVFGAIVKIMDLEKEAVKEYNIVGEDEIDLKNGKISLHSPVGKALIGHKVGDTVVIKAPAGDRQYEIREIRFE
ncbi:MAG: transcription elongation factor GreA [Nitrospirae bacterium]|nr:transcription elongation factor GreA [Nitrospirota bacterium]